MELKFEIEEGIVYLLENWFNTQLVIATGILRYHLFFEINFKDFEKSYSLEDWSFEDILEDLLNNKVIDKKEHNNIIKNVKEFEKYIKEK